MGRKDKISPAIKIRYVKRFIAREISKSEAARGCGVHEQTFGIWVAKYKAEGPEGLHVQKQNKKYPEQLKRNAVEEYLHGGISLIAICEKYAISSTYPLRNWIKEYNAHRKLKSNSGGSRMSKTRKTTQEERLEIVKYCILKGKDYGDAAIRYSVSYQNVYQWVHRYEKLGIDGLEDRRGKKPGSVKPRTPEEELRARVAQLEARNRDLQMENDLLKNWTSCCGRNAFADAAALQIQGHKGTGRGERIPGVEDVQEARSGTFCILEMEEGSEKPQ